MRREPRACKDERSPPGEAKQHERAGDARDQFDETAGDEIHRDLKRRTGHAKIEVARHGQIRSQRCVFKMSHAWRPYARLRQPVVEPGGRPVTKVRTDGLMDGCEHLKKDEDRAHERERLGERVSVLDGTNEDAHRNRKNRRQDAAQEENRPPGQRQKTVSPRQGAEESPLVSPAEGCQLHGGGS
jgi:hypothetical protein